MFDKLFDIIKELGLIASLKNKLFQNPDKAAEKMVVVFEELSKVYLAIDLELANYLSLHFEPDAELPNERKQLLQLEGIQLQDRINNARGHCHKIERIYFQYLDKWFARVFTAQEYNQMQQLFMQLSNADGAMLEAIDRLRDWLETKATQTLDLVDHAQLEEANQLIRESRKELAPLRKGFSQATTALHTLKNDFIQISSIV